MKNYSIDIYRITRKGRELVMRMEFPRERFTAREYKDYLIANVFMLAGESIDYKHLVAEAKCNGKKFLTVYCDTKMDGATITAYLKAARPREIFRPLRVMEIAS